MTEAQVLEDDIDTLLGDLRQAGIRLYLDGDALRVRGTRDALTPELTRRVQAAKSALRVRLQAVAVSTAASTRIPRRSPGERVGLSFLQQNLWLIDQLEGSVHYNMAVALDARGIVEADALEKALGRIVARHESLRTVFLAAPDGKPFQQVVPEVSFSMERVDLRHLSQVESVEEMERIAAMEAKAPFDLSRDLMLRARLLRLADDRHVLLVTKHHIASDGWSMDVLLDEMCRLYEAFRAGQDDPLPPLPIQYADYSAWLAHWLHGDVLREKLDYWQERLAGLPELHALPLDRPRPPRRTINGGRHSRSLALSRPDALAALCSRYDVTLFTLLESVFALLVARWSGAEDIAVATPISARTRPELAGLIGYFTNTLVLRSDCRGERTFEDLLASSRQMMLEAHDHHHVPFEMLVDRINPARSLAYNALVQLSFTLQNNRAATVGVIDLPGLRIAPLRNDEHASVKFDLELTVKEDAEGLLAKWNYNTDIFDASTIERMDLAFGVLLEAILDDPTLPLAEYPIMPPGDAETLASWNQTALDVDGDATLHGLFRQSALKSPDTIALVEGERTCTYGELDRRSDLLAGYLVRAFGASPGQVVGVGVPRSIDMVVALLGVLKSGAAYLPLDPSLPIDRLAWMIEDSRAIAIIGRDDVVDAFSATAPSVPLIHERDAAEEETPPPMAGCSDDLAYVIYTSGSTGRPKGTLNRHRGVCNRVQGMRAQFGLTEADRVLQKTPLGFDVSVSEIFWPLASGATLVLASPDGHRDPSYLYDLLRDQGVTVAHFVPSMLQAFLLVNPEPALPCLRYLLTSGEALPRELQEQCVRVFPQVRKHNQYGPTETAIEVTGWCFDACRHDGVVPIGRPTANVRTYVLDGVGREQPIGVAGELHIAGVQVGDGYLNRPSLTAERFMTSTIGGRTERVYRTGDRARWLADGELQFLGRLDGQVKLRGFRIETGEIESALVQHAGVSRAGVMLREDDGPGSARLVAYVVAPPGVAADDAALRAALMRHLPEYMLPSNYVWLDELPLTTSGKLDRKALPAPTRRRAEVTDRAPSTPTESVLMALYEELLGTRPDGVSGHFFELGGHSLLATQLATTIRARFNVDMPLRVVFEHPSIQDLAAWIDGQSHGTGLPPIEPRGDAAGVLSYAQQRLWMLSRLGDAARAYNIPRALALSGPLDQDALVKAFAAIVTRHENLRLCFPERDGEPQVRVLPPYSPLLLVDLLDVPADEQGNTIEERRRAHATRGFDLGDGPLFAAELLRTGVEEHVLLINLQHIVGDGWSIGIFMEELAALYGAFRDGRASPLAPLSIQYPDYAAWQRRWLEGARMEAQLTYWSNTLAGSPALLALPADRPRPPVFSYRGAHHRATFDRGLVGPLRELSRRHGCTMFMTLLAAYQVFLATHAETDDVSVGTPVANREHPQTAGLIGFFVNTVVMRARIDSASTFGDLLDTTRRTALDAYQNQDVPFDRVVEALHPARLLDRGPLFQAMFRHEVTGQAPYALPGIALRQIVSPGGTAQCDLMLNVIEDGDELQGEWEYATDLFDADRVAAWHDRFEDLLRWLVEAMDTPRPLGELRLISDQEREQARSRRDEQAAAAVASTQAPVAQPMAAPVGDVEVSLAALWRDILNVSPIGRHDNFFDLGGHSLSAIRLQAAIRGEFNHDIALTAIFQSASLAELAEAIASTHHARQA